MARIRMLLVDDNLDFRKGVSAWLADEPRIEIVGTACSGREALERVAELKPDLVLMDVSMPEIDGFEATRRMKSNSTGTEAPLVVLMTFYHSETAKQEAWAAGADGFLSKASLTGELLGLVRDLLSQRLETMDDGSDRLGRGRKVGVSAADAHDPDQLSPGLGPGEPTKGGRAPLISEEEK